MLQWPPLVGCIVILHCRYKITLAINPIAHHQCCLGQAETAQVLTLEGEEMENFAEHQYSEKVKGYKSSIKTSVFNTTRQNLLSPEGAILYTASCRYTSVYSATSLLKGQHPVVNCQEAQLSDIDHFLICLLSDKRSILHWVILLPSCKWLIHWEMISSCKT